MREAFLSTGAAQFDIIAISKSVAILIAEEAEEDAEEEDAA